MTHYQRAQRKLASIIKKAARERDAKGYRENLGYDQGNKFQDYLNQLDLTYSQHAALTREFDTACDKL